MNKYNDKYKTNLILIILQSTENLIEIIEKVKYCLDISFDNINFIEENVGQNNSLNNNIIVDNDKMELIDAENSSANELEFQKFFPKKIVKKKDNSILW